MNVNGELLIPKSLWCVELFCFFKISDLVNESNKNSKTQKFKSTIFFNRSTKKIIEFLNVKIWFYEILNSGSKNPKVRKIRQFW